MLGNMMNKPLQVSSLIDHAARWHGNTSIVSFDDKGALTRTSWLEIQKNAKQVAAWLVSLGLEPGTRCATLAWNTNRHLELYYAISGAGFVCHTINPRLFEEQIEYIINHAEDRVLFFDPTFADLVKRLRPKLDTDIVLVPLAGMGDGLDVRISYDEILATPFADFAWPELDEQSASSLCYTSGTTGHPKGVLYSHRSTVLHAYAASLPDVFSLSARDTVMPVVPMFHVNAWGIPYAAAMNGARLVLPGAKLDGSSLLHRIIDEKVTLALGVPTVWQGVLAAAEQEGLRLESLQRIAVGGSSCPPVLMDKMRDAHGVDVIHLWGMTEISPVGTANQPLAAHSDLSRAEHAKLRESQGRPPFGIDLEVFDDSAKPQPHDGIAQGNLHASGYWVLDRYFNRDEEADIPGWFATGDVSTIDPDGFMTIRDRSKDIIKSGGEWISSVELENIALEHPDVEDAAVIGCKHEKWDERPVLVVVPKQKTGFEPEQVLAIYDGRIARWQCPDKVVTVDQLPRNATGKVQKLLLRNQFGDCLVSA